LFGVGCLLEEMGEVGLFGFPGDDFGGGVVYFPLDGGLDK
jgi:hypothetical protein